MFYRSLSSLVFSNSIENKFKCIKKAIPLHVSLLAVSKNNSAKLIRQLSVIGQQSFGENRVQEAILKQDLLNDLTNLDWHFIGRIQSNKVRKIVIHFNTIHSVSNFSLVKQLHRIAIEENRKPEILLQIKLLSDQSKVGFSSKELLKSWHMLAALKPLNLIGLMIIAPLSTPSRDRRGLFVESRKLIQVLGLQKSSVGMSNDWREAIVEGSNCIRIGSALFGH
uniref:Pyridoxal phosphate homeostasis protein n=1 Tax=Paulinella longichromatophora TaxID=1708747 RepID=A0A2H4ZNW6_9EUKA|nr:hypothetical protein PLO_203 [Paulinella longichromatophora]